MSPSRGATSAPYGSDPTGDHFRSSGFWMRSAACACFRCSATSPVEMKNATTAIATDPAYPRYVRLIVGPPEWPLGNALSTRFHGFQVRLTCAMATSPALRPSLTGSRGRDRGRLLRAPQRPHVVLIRVA